MPRNPNIYLTTPIYYTNGLPHIGHTYTTIVADTIRRYKRMRGFDVVMTTGTDEHGVNVERSAKKAGVPESEFVARMADDWRALWDDLGIPADEFIRTTDIKHAHTVQWLFRQCRDNGYIYKGHYTGQYCVYDNAYVDVQARRSLSRLRPPHRNRHRRELFFQALRISEAAARFLREESGFHPAGDPPQRDSSFVEGGLHDLTITRTRFAGAFPFPAKNHTFSTSGSTRSPRISAPSAARSTKSEAIWPADLHLVGKEIIRFHAVYWPAFLMAARLPLPKQIWAHGWLLMDSDKMSKSNGNVVRPRPIVNMLGMDALRYYLLREIVFGQDGNFSYDALVTRYNSDLANGLGNLASRTAAMIEKNCAGKIPKPAKLQPQDEALAQRGANRNRRSPRSTTRI